MAGHSQFKNIMHRKGAQDAKKTKLFTKLVREIMVAAQTGQPDPEFNPRLRTATIAARRAGVPRDRIETAIKKGSGELTGEKYEDVRYEGYGPNGIAIIVEALTDNRNRTASDVRSVFTKNGGNLGETGSVGFMFTKLGAILFPASIASADAVFEAAVELGADNVESDSNSHTIFCAPESLASVRDALTEKFGEPESAQLIWHPNLTTELDLETARTILKLTDALEDLDDVQNVFGNYSVSDEVAEMM